MIRTEIFVENTRLDLSKDLSSEFTYNIDDIQDFASRNTSFSKTIILPGNAVNNKVFGHIFEFGSSNYYDPLQPNVGYNFNPAKSAACIIYVDKIQVFKGVLRLLEIVIDNGSIEYECAVFGELGGFVSALGNARLEQLDFSAYDHVWNITNITNSWDTINGSGYFYPLIDYGKVSTQQLYGNRAKKDWDVKAFRPALYVREYMDKIITGAGYTYEAPFFNTALFRRLIIPQNQKELTKQTSALNVATLSIPQEIRGSSNINFTTVTGSGLVVSNANSAFTYTGGSPVSMKIPYEFYGSSTSGAFNITVNNATVYSEQFFGGFALSGEITVTLNQNDVIRFRFVNTATDRDDPPVDVESGLVNFSSVSSIAAVLSYGDSFNMSDVIPKGIFQRDFFASIIKMFNLYVVEDVNKKNHLVIKPYIDFYDTGLSLLEINDFSDLLLVNDTDFLLLADGNMAYLDWTYKVDRSKAIRLKPMSELNGRYFEYKYKSDTDYYNEQYSKKYSQGYGDFIEDTGYEFAKDKQTAEIIFAATPLVGYPSEDKVASTILKITNQGSGNEQIEDSTDHVIRILQAKKVEGVQTYAILNGLTPITNLTKYGYGGHLDDPDAPMADLNFGAPSQLYFQLTTDYPAANLFNGYWSDYVAEITDKDSKVLTCNVKLTNMDIYSLDFSKLIYIDGTLWRLNKVSDYNPSVDDTTKCEFLKVIQLTYE